MAEFSYEQNIAPFATKFFGEIGSDRFLSAADKAQLQGKLVGGVHEIETQRQKLENERKEGRLRDLQYSEGINAFDEAKARRSRIEQAAAKRGGIKAQAQGILASADPEPVKREKLGLLQLETSDLDDPQVSDIFRAAETALPPAKKSAFSPEQLARFAAEDVPQEVISSGDPFLIGQAISRAAARKEALESRKKELESSTEGKKKLLESDFKFQKGEDDIETEWLDDNSTQEATLVVEAFGTPQEKAKFAALKGAPSDSERALLARNIQLRERLKGLAGSKADRAKSITGL